MKEKREKQILEALKRLNTNKIYINPRKGEISFCNFKYPLESQCYSYGTYGEFMEVYQLLMSFNIKSVEKRKNSLRYLMIDGEEVKINE